MICLYCWFISDDDVIVHAVWDLINVKLEFIPLGDTLFTALRQCWMVPRCQTTSNYMAAFIISTGLMPFWNHLLIILIHKVPHPLYRTKAVLDGSKYLTFFSWLITLVFTLMIAPGYYLHYVLACRGGGWRPS